MSAGVTASTTQQNNGHTREKPKGKDHEGGVAKIEQRSHFARHVEVQEKVYRIQEDVEGTAAGHEKGAPPPVIVLSHPRELINKIKNRRITLRPYLGAELQIGHDNGNFRADDDQDQENEEEKAKKVVHLVFPNSLGFEGRQ